MKNKNYELSKSKKKLDELKRRGVKSVLWSLKPEMAEYLSRFYDVSPYLFTIRTKTFPNIHFVKNHLIKDVHYSKKKGKDLITRKLNQDEDVLLTLDNVKHWPAKYLIILN